MYKEKYVAAFSEASDPNHFAKVFKACGNSDVCL